MRTPAQAALAALGLLAVVLLAWLGIQSGDEGPSSLSRGPDGWWLARNYLEAQNTPTLEIREALGSEGAHLPGDALLVLAFPWRTIPDPTELQGITAHLRGGGTVIVAYSGLGGQLAERMVLDRLGAGLESLDQREPLAPVAWWKWARAPRDLEAGEAWESEGLASGAPAAQVRTPPLDHVPRPAGQAQPLYRLREDQTTIAFTAPVLAGRLIALPASLLGNAQLRRNPGNGDVLEALRRNLGGPWAFYERAHGLRPVGELAAAPPVSRRVLDLFLGHVILLYLLAIWALARRFGPAWRDVPRRSSSNAAFLRSLGLLHHRLGHHRAGARQILRRAFELTRRRQIPAALSRQAEAVRDGAALVALAREVSHHRRQSQPTFLPAPTAAPEASPSP